MPCIMMLVGLCWVVASWNLTDSTILLISWMRIDWLVLGSRESSGFISVVLELAKSCFLQCFPDQVLLKTLQWGAIEQICCFQADHFQFCLKIEFWNHPSRSDTSVLTFCPICSSHHWLYHVMALHVNSAESSRRLRHIQPQTSS